MSIEFPEAFILAKQMKKELFGKKVKSFDLKNAEKAQKDGLIGQSKEFHLLIDRIIQDVIVKGMTIVVDFDKQVNLILFAEFGGKIHYHIQTDSVPKNYQLLLTFDDKTILTVRVSFGYIRAVFDDQLEEIYIYKRDFGVPSPLDDEFSVEWFIETLNREERRLRPLLVGKEAIVGGIGNYSWQEIIYRAKLSPKAQTSDLSKKDMQRLFSIIQKVVRHRIAQGGKNKFVDLYGKLGETPPVLGSFMLNKPCPRCGTAIDKISLGGGSTYYCPNCQEIK
jgi:formamidopyrimidine-DNA glycosylase